MTRRQTNHRTHRFFAIALPILCVAAVVVAFLFVRQISLLPWEGKTELRNAQSVIESSVVIDPDHVHVGDVFTLTLRVAYRSESVRVNPLPSQELLQNATFDVLAAQMVATKNGSMHHYEYRYKLQALNVLPGERYTVKFASLHYAQAGEEKEFSPPVTAVDIVPRFLEDADPALARPYGKIQTHHQLLQRGMEGLAVFFFFTALGITFARLKKKRIARALNPMDEVCMRYENLKVMLNDPRGTLYAVENVAVSLAALQGITALQLWQENYPAHLQTPNPWDKFWHLVMCAYNVAPNTQQAEEAHSMLGALITYYTREEIR
jgi:hypothetical protein